MKGLTTTNGLGAAWNFFVCVSDGKALLTAYWRAVLHRRNFRGYFFLATGRTENYEPEKKGRQPFAFRIRCTLTQSIGPSIGNGSVGNGKDAVDSIGPNIGLNF